MIQCGEADLDLDRAFLIAIPVERVRVLLGSLACTLRDGDPLPS